MTADVERAQPSIVLNGRLRGQLNPIEGVPVYADRRLLDVLRRSNPELWPGGPFSRGTPSIRLALPEQRIEFLDGPIVMLGRGAP